MELQSDVDNLSILSWPDEPWHLSYCIVEFLILRRTSTWPWSWKHTSHQLQIRIFRLRISFHKKNVTSRLYLRWRVLVVAKEPRHLSCTPVCWGLRRNMKKIIKGILSWSVSFYMWKTSFFWVQTHKFHPKLRSFSPRNQAKLKILELAVHLKVATLKNIVHWRLATRKNIVHWKLATRENIVHWKLATRKDIVHWKQATRKRNLCR